MELPQKRAPARADCVAQIKLGDIVVDQRVAV